MKKRKLLTDIFTVVLMVAIVLVLLAYLGVFPGDVEENGSLSHILLSYVSVPIALLSVAMIDLVFPLIDNRALLQQNSYKIKTAIKIVLFLAAVVFGMLFFLGGVFNSLNEFVGVAIFVGLYIAQFCINLDPKPQAEPEEEDEADRYAQYDVDAADEDDDT